jgi:hypothetical protein
LEHDDVVAVMEAFWDSSVARFGERGAKGWNAFVDAAGQYDLPSGTAAVGEKGKEFTLNLICRVVPLCN